MMKILTGTGHPELAELIAATAGVDLCATDITRFPDGEIFVKIVIMFGAMISLLCSPWRWIQIIC